MTEPKVFAVERHVIIDGDHCEASLKEFPPLDVGGGHRAMMAIERMAASARTEIERDAYMKFRFGGN